MSMSAKYQNPSTAKMIAADGTPLTIVTHVSHDNTLVVRVFRDDELRLASPFMRGECVANAKYLAETIEAR